MIVPLRGARIEIVRWRSDADARRHLTKEAAELAPFYIGSWHSDSRVSSIVATNLARVPIWTALMAEATREPWIVPAFGGLLFLSSENLLLVDSSAQVMARRDGLEGLWQDQYQGVWDVLVGEAVIWIVGEAQVIGVMESGIRVIRPGGGWMDEWWLQGDRLFGRDEECVYEISAFDSIFCPFED